MIISHKYKFIFLKTKKTAGTSFEIALSRYLGEDDVVTPISPECEALRQEKATGDHAITASRCAATMATACSS